MYDLSVKMGCHHSKALIKETLVRSFSTVYIWADSCLVIRGAKFCLDLQCSKILVSRDKHFADVFCSIDIH